MSREQLRFNRPLATALSVFIIAACVLGITSAAAAQLVGETNAITRPGDGSPVCGLGSAFHAGRRAALSAELGEGIILVRGLPVQRDYNKFHQDKTFWYLTGVESPGASLLIDIDAGEQILFVAPPDRRKERWDGELWDAEDAWISELTGFEDVRSSDALMTELERRIGDGRTVWISMHPWAALAGGFDVALPYHAQMQRDALDGRVSREDQLRTQLEMHFNAQVRDCSPAIAKLRRIKQPEEIAAMKRAADAGAIAMVEAMRSTRPGLGEWELDAMMSFVHIQHGAAGLAYHAIVGSGPNSCVLHYSASSRRMQDGELLLIDYGPQVDYYTSDITRTWPVNGRFTEKQADMYDAVLAAQNAAIEAAKPGVTFGELARIVREVLAARGYANMMPHGLSHYIGMEVHDVGDYRLPLEPGVAITIEPGIYDESTSFGIRIEDVIIITEDGNENITRGVPVERDAIENLIAEPGVLDWMHARERAATAMGDR